MKKLILNEVKYVDDVLKNYDGSKELDVNIPQLIHLVARYRYKQMIESKDPSDFEFRKTTKTDGGQEKVVINYKKLNRLIDLLVNDVTEDMCRIPLQNFVYRLNRKNIDVACSFTVKYSIMPKEFDNIPIYKKELDNVKSFEDEQLRKMLFTLYILSRYIGKNGKIDETYIGKQLFDLANLTGTSLDKYKLMKVLREKEFISQNQINDSIAVWVNPVEIGENEKPVFCIDELENVGKKMICFLDKNKIMCQRCAKVVKKSSSRKYCKVCARIINIEKTRENAIKRAEQAKKLENLSD